MRAFDYRRARRVDDAVTRLPTAGTQLLAGRDQSGRPDEGGCRATRAYRRHQPPAAVGCDADARRRRAHRSLGSQQRHRQPSSVRERYPLLSQALLAARRRKLRNMATVGGNLLQRTRCHYFYDTAFAACNKRSPGSGCAALRASTGMHAIFGASENCIATHPSDMAVALAALDAIVVTRRAGGERRDPDSASSIACRATTPERDTNLRRDELIIERRSAAVAIRRALALSEGARPRELCVRARVGRGRARRAGWRWCATRASYWAASPTSHGALEQAERAAGRDARSTRAAIAAAARKRRRRAAVARQRIQGRLLAQRAVAHALPDRRRLRHERRRHDRRPCRSIASTARSR